MNVKHECVIFKHKVKNVLQSLVWKNQLRGTDLSTEQLLIKNAVSDDQATD